jgi:hypothetical protein
MKIYPSDVTDSQWQVIKNIFDNDRKRKHKMREIVNAILYLTDRLSMANVAQGICSMANGLLLFPQMETGWADRRNS